MISTLDLSVDDFNLPNLCCQFEEAINDYLPSNASTEQDLLQVEGLFATGLQQIYRFVNVNGRLLDIASVKLEYPNLIELSASLLPIDSHHKSRLFYFFDNLCDVTVVLDDQIASLRFNSFNPYSLRSTGNFYCPVARWMKIRLSSMTNFMKSSRHMCFVGSLIYNKPW